MLVPTQLGKHFWPEWATVAGVRVDYLAPTLYLADIVWIFLVIFTRSINLGFLKSKKFWVGVILIAINIVVATSKWEAIYRWVRISQVVWLILRIKNTELRTKNYLLWIIPIWIIVESWLGLAQVVNGGSLGGIWWWLGERRFALGGIGLAEWQVAGEAVVRAYGTFSHPNSMAGFLLVSLVYWYSRNKKLGWRKWIVIWSGVLGIVLSGSRVVWVLGLVFWLWKMGWKKTVVMAGIIIMALGVISMNYRVRDFVGGWDSNSISKRLELVRQAGAMIKADPLFGVGAGNFLVAQPKFEIEGQGRWRQPVHNIFLLWISEFGMIITGLGIFILRKIKFSKEKLIIMGIIAVTGMVDHYWLTLPQNWWLMAIMLAV